jgi:hypothetical protein
MVEGKAVVSWDAERQERVRDGCSGTGTYRLGLSACDGEEGRRRGCRDIWRGRCPGVPGRSGITKRMETRRNFNHFLPGPGARFIKAMREKFLEGTLPVGPGWAAPVPHLLLVIPAQTGSSQGPDPSPRQPRQTGIRAPACPSPGPSHLGCRRLSNSKLQLGF